jgi:outer membrane lipoprotein-sorting protein
MKLQKITLPLFLVVFVFIAAGCRRQAPPPETVKQEQLSEFPGKTITVKQSVSFNGQKVSGTFTVPEGQDALRLLKTFRVVTDKPDTGVVVSIEGTVDAADKSWVLYVNGKKGPQYTGLYNPKDGDILEWKLEFK